LSGPDVGLQAILEGCEAFGHDDQNGVPGDAEGLQLALVGGAALKPLDDLGGLDQRQFSDALMARRAKADLPPLAVAVPIPVAVFR
jgi:hypothetical protein